MVRNPQGLAGGGGSPEAHLLSTPGGFRHVPPGISQSHQAQAAPGAHSL